MQGWERGCLTPDLPHNDINRAEKPAPASVEIKFRLLYHVVIKMDRR